MGTIQVRVNFLCGNCECDFDRLEMEETLAENGRCPSCEADNWTAHGFIRGRTSEKHIAANIVGLTLLATTGQGFIKFSDTEVNEINFRERVTAGEVIELTRTYGYVQADLIAKIPVRRRKEYLAKLEELKESRGVNCFLCHDVFVPKTIKAKHDLNKQDQFSHDYYCSGRCFKKIRDKELELKCKQCQKAFVAPEAPADLIMARYWKPRQWHSDGYCSEKCGKGGDGGGCLVCKKPFKVTKLNYLPIHEQIISAQKAGFCGLQCQEKGVPEPTQTGGSVKAAEDSKNEDTISARCHNNHQFKVPRTHNGLIAFCVECESRLKIEFQQA